jgi:alpha-L-rhamnosidase
MAADNSAALPAHRLLAEFMPSPSIVDTAAPRFAWHVAASDGARRVSQTAFQLQVCAVVGPRVQRWDGSTWECEEDCSPTAERACAWDSGRVNSSAHWGVAYNGAQASALQSDSSYGWRVKWWAEQADSAAAVAGVLSPPTNPSRESEATWSAVARMDTAFIGGVVALPGAEWIGLAPSAFAAAALGTTQLRTTFELPAGAVATRARAYVASPGYYTLCIDGKEADEDSVLGAFTVFTRKILYDALDVTRLLALAHGGGGGNDNATGNSSSGTARHALAITLANGWYSQPTVNLGPRMVSVVLRVDYTHPQQGNNALQSGTVTVVSDGAWRETHGPETANDFYVGVTHDARQETPGWQLANYTEGGAGRWGAAAVLPSPLLPGGAGEMRVAGMPPVRRCETLEPRTVEWFPPTAKNPAGWVVDFGQNIAGQVQLTIPPSVLAAAPAGSNITVRHAEVSWPNGSLHHMYGANAEVTTYVVGGKDRARGDTGATVFEPRHTYSGFRFVEISGSALPTAAAGDGALPVSVVAHFIHSDLEQTGNLSTSSHLLNKIVQAATFSQVGNWMSVPTGCTQRERRGWLGDAQLGSEGVMHTMFAPAAYAKFLGDIANTQEDEWAMHNGSVPEVCPNYGHGPIPPDPPFGIGYAVLWWNQYRYYDDKVALSQHYSGVKAFAETLIVRAGGGGTRAGVLDRSTSTHGDWVSVANRSAGATTCSGRAALDHHSNTTCCEFMECPDAVVNGFYYVTLLRILAAAADVLRHAADVTRYEALARDAASELAAAEYSASDHVMGYGYQADQAMALALGSSGGVLPSEGDFAAVAAGLAADVDRQGGHLSTGIFGTKVLLPALSSTGYGDAAMGVLTQTTAPGWGAWVTEHDATTLFEMWGAFDGAEGKGVASHNHVMFSSFMPWLYQTVAGVAMDDGDFGAGVLPPPASSGVSAGPPPTGFSRFRVAPRLLGELSSAAATVVTMRGSISVSWLRSASAPTVWLNVTIPVGADTAVTVPVPRVEGCGPDRVTVREGASPNHRLVWGHGTYIPGVPGITGAQAVTTAGLGGVQVTTGSGTYQFSAAC